MLFRGDMEPCCAYCKHGSQLSIDQVACIKRGIVPLWSFCRKFSYDPLKREPDRPRKLPIPDEVSPDEVFRL